MVPSLLFCRLQPQVLNVWTRSISSARVVKKREEKLSAEDFRAGEFHHSDTRRNRSEGVLPSGATWIYAAAGYDPPPNEPRARHRRGVRARLEGTPPCPGCRPLVLPGSAGPLPVVIAGVICRAQRSAAHGHGALVRRNIFRPLHRLPSAALHCPPCRRPAVTPQLKPPGSRFALRLPRGTASLRCRRPAGRW